MSSPPEPNDQRPRGSNRDGNQPAVGHDTQRGLGAAASNGAPNRVVTLAREVPAMPTAVRYG